MNGNDFADAAESFADLTIPERSAVCHLLSHHQGLVAQGERKFHSLSTAGRENVRGFLEFASSRGVRDALEALDLVWRESQ